jgi:hypothetical protein
MSDKKGHIKGRPDRGPAGDHMKKYKDGQYPKDRASVERLPRGTSSAAFGEGFDKSELSTPASGDKGQKTKPLETQEIRKVAREKRDTPEQSERKQSHQKKLHEIETGARRRKAFKEKEIIGKARTLAFGKTPTEVARIISERDGITIHTSPNTVELYDLVLRAYQDSKPEMEPVPESAETKPLLLEEDEEIEEKARINKMIDEELAHDQEMAQEEQTARLPQRKVESEVSETASQLEMPELPEDLENGEIPEEIEKFVRSMGGFEAVMNLFAKVDRQLPRNMKWNSMRQNMAKITDCLCQKQKYYPPMGSRKLSDSGWKWLEEKSTGYGSKFRFRE